MKSISIIIPALNEQVYLPRLLESIVDQKYSGEYEVIVVDGGSTDKTVAIAKKFQERIPNLAIYKCKTGTSRQRNYGAARAQYDNLIFLDADAKLPADTLAKLAKHFDSKDNFIALPLLLPYDGKLIDLFLGTIAYSLFILISRTTPVVCGMCTLTTKQVHNRIGGFNERVSFAEDFEYGLRAYRSGAKYYILFNTLVTASARRLQKMGRLQIALTWFKWYRETLKHGAVIDNEKYQYEFGKFEKGSN